MLHALNKINSVNLYYLLCANCHSRYWGRDIAWMRRVKSLLSGNLTFYLGKQATNRHKNKDIIGWVITIMEKVKHYGNSWLLRGQTRKLLDPVECRDKRLSKPQSHPRTRPWWLVSLCSRMIRQVVSRCWMPRGEGRWLRQAHNSVLLDPSGRFTPDRLRGPQNPRGASMRKQGRL